VLKKNLSLVATALHFKKILPANATDPSSLCPHNMPTRLGLDKDVRTKSLKAVTKKTSCVEQHYFNEALMWLRHWL
jgi:hypothetical protein